MGSSLSLGLAFEPFEEKTPLEKRRAAALKKTAEQFKIVKRPPLFETMSEQLDQIVEQNNEILALLKKDTPKDVKVDDITIGADGHVESLTVKA